MIGFDVTSEHCYQRCIPKAMENLRLSLGMLVVFPTFNVRVVYSGIIQMISSHVCGRRRFAYVGEM